MRWPAPRPTDIGSRGTPLRIESPNRDRLAIRVIMLILALSHASASVNETPTALTGTPGRGKISRPRPARSDGSLSATVNRLASSSHAPRDFATNGRRRSSASRTGPMMGDLSASVSPPCASFRLVQNNSKSLSATSPTDLASGPRATWTGRRISFACLLSATVTPVVPSARP